VLKHETSTLRQRHNFISIDFKFGVGDNVLEVTNPEKVVMASRRPIYTCQLTGYATESNKKKYICCFMRVTRAINNIYKLVSFLK